METQTHNQVFYEDESFTFSYELSGTVAGLHCEVRKWNKDTLRTMYSVFAHFLDCCKYSNVGEVLSISPNPKFCKLFGAYETSSFILAGREYKVMKWDLK